MDTNVERVYCSDCEYYLRLNGFGLRSPAYETCEKVTGYVDTPTHRVEATAKFNVDNKNNNCQYYEPRNCKCEPAPPEKRSWLKIIWDTLTSVTKQL